MSIDGRQCITTSSTELNCDFALMEADQKVIDYVTARTPFGPFTPIYPDKDAMYAQFYDLNVGDLERPSCWPHQMSKVKPQVKLKDVNIDFAFVGACTNGLDLKICE